MEDRVSTKLAKMYKNGNFEEIKLTDLISNFNGSGSRVFGGYKDDSDYDFLVGPPYNRMGFAICTYFNADREDYYNEEIYSYSFTIKSGKKINLIFFREKSNYSAWIFATINLRRLYRVGSFSLKMMIEDKKTRCDLFQKFVSMFKEFD